MAFDRRSILMALMSTGLLPGCAKATSTARPRTGLLADRYFLPDGRVVDTGNGGISHSEGQGYAMLAAESLGDRTSFDRLWAWTRANLLRSDMALFSWRYDVRTTPAVSDPNNASDGDILIAWALARAARRWKVKDYEAESARIRLAIRDHLLVRIGQRVLLLPGLVGFAKPHATTLNPAYYVWPALDAFRRLDGNGAWGQMIADGEWLLAQARFGPLRLTCDWVDFGPEIAPMPAHGRPPRFGFDAVRVPLYFAWSGRTAPLESYRAFWGGLLAQSRPIPAWVNVVDGTQAEFPLSRGGFDVVNYTLGLKATPTPFEDTDYYSAALAEMVRIARSDR